MFSFKRNNFPCEHVYGTNETKSERDIDQYYDQKINCRITFKFI